MAFFGTIAGMCAFRRRSFVDVILFGIIVVYLASLLNEHLAPWGAVALSVFFAIIIVGGIFSSRRRLRDNPPMQRTGGGGNL